MNYGVVAPDEIAEFEDGEFTGNREKQSVKDRAQNYYSNRAQTKPQALQKRQANTQLQSKSRSPRNKLPPAVAKNQAVSKLKSKNDQKISP